MNKKTLPPPPDFDSPEEAKDIIHFLWNKLAELEDRLNQNSRNSSVPSSQQPLHNKAKNTSPNRKKSGKKPGAQPGHKGHRRQLHPIEDNASVEQYLPKKTCHCGGCVIPNRKPYKRHQIFDLPDISYTLVEHQVG
ncbi:TPA: IS66 family transposase, partial [Vibrio vulnificus]|nr:IS66 family transposase [Vibrio vulnificus]